MKDWKAEYEKQRGIIQELTKQLDWERQQRREREEREEIRRENMRHVFKDLFLDVIGR